MDPSLNVLLVTAAFLAFVHTLMGPDHYVPFIVLARARRWSMWRTGAVTLACGAAHVASSVGLGMLGILFGWSLGHLTAVEGTRAALAGWLLLGFGIAYLAWGLRRAARAHSHARVDQPPERELTPWLLFLIFGFGPCEPLIPVLMYPAAQGSWIGVFSVTSIFAGCTILTMLAIVLTGYLGLSRLSFGWFERYSHALAGLALVASGVAIQVGL